ncbi:LysR family transcriptional regulator [Zongyangia hominis]|uniref:LysR family transcriptional regulator n=1 Tax=Zongyangia hominis TaxID=2763677 RepID=A0A926ED27_9FIRM|nr:LysR family transcriptional regulator [Zongyangia hominis]MBC8569994.1 LysR family transcriptional regulator [Zongyangia hominis]
MDIKQLSYFTAIVEEGNISAAAKRLHLSQPPLSSQMKALEEELGMQLFIRGPRKIMLTPAGELMYKRAKQILALTTDTRRDLEELDHRQHVTLRLGTISSSGAMLLEKRMIAFHEAFPQIRFEIHEGNTYELIESLRAGIIELAVVRTPFAAEGLSCTSLDPEPLVAVGAPRYFAGEGTLVSLAELGEQPLIFYRRFEPLILSAFERVGVQPQVLCKNDDARTTLLWANAGLGVGIVPQTALKIIESADTTYKIIAEPSFTTCITAVYPQSAHLSLAGRQFLRFFAGEEGNGEEEM